MDIALAQSANSHHVEASYMPYRVCSRRQPALCGVNVPMQPRLSLDLVTGPPSFPGAYFQHAPSWMWCTWKLSFFEPYYTLCTCCSYLLLTNEIHCKTFHNLRCNSPLQSSRVLNRLDFSHCKTCWGKSCDEKSITLERNWIKIETSRFHEVRKYDLALRVSAVLSDSVLPG